MPDLSVGSTVVSAAICFFSAQQVMNKRGLYFAADAERIKNS
jgi:hypothetical protein